MTNDFVFPRLPAIHWDLTRSQPADAVTPPPVKRRSLRPHPAPAPTTSCQVRGAACVRVAPIGCGMGMPPPLWTAAHITVPSFAGAAAAARPASLVVPTCGRSNRCRCRCRCNTRRSPPTAPRANDVFLRPLPSCIRIKGRFMMLILRITD